MNTQATQRRIGFGIGQRVRQINAQPWQLHRLRRIFAFIGGPVFQRMVQPVMRNRIGPDQQFKTEHPPGQIAQCHRCGRATFIGHNLFAHPFGNAEQECAGACCRIENGHGGIAQTLSAKIITQRPVERTCHVPNDLNRRVIHAIFFARGGIECL